MENPENLPFNLSNKESSIILNETELTRYANMFDQLSITKAQENKVKEGQIDLNTQFKIWLKTYYSISNLSSLLSKMNKESQKVATKIIAATLDPNFLNELIKFYLPKEVARTNLDLFLREDELLIYLIIAKQEPFLDLFFNKHLSNALKELDKIIKKNLDKSKENLTFKLDKQIILKLNSTLENCLNSFLKDSILIPVEIGNICRLIFQAFEGKLEPKNRLKYVGYYLFSRFISYILMHKISPKESPNYQTSMRTILLNPLQVFGGLLGETNFPNSNKKEANLAWQSWIEHYKKTLLLYQQKTEKILLKLCQSSIIEEEKYTKKILTRTASSPSKGTTLIITNMLSNKPERNRSGSFIDTVPMIDINANPNDYSLETFYHYFLRTFYPGLIKNEELKRLNELLTKILPLLTDKEIKELKARFNSYMEELKHPITQEIMPVKDLKSSSYGKDAIKSIKLIGILNAEILFLFYKDSYYSNEGAKKSFILSSITEFFQEYNAEYVNKINEFIIKDTTERKSSVSKNQDNESLSNETPRIQKTF